MHVSFLFFFVSHTWSSLCSKIPGSVPGNMDYKGCPKSVDKSILKTQCQKQTMIILISTRFYLLMVLTTLILPCTISISSFSYDNNIKTIPILISHYTTSDLSLSRLMKIGVRILLWNMSIYRLLLIHIWQNINANKNHIESYFTW